MLWFHQGQIFLALCAIYQLCLTPDSAFKGIISRSKDLGVNKLLSIPLLFLVQWIKKHCARCWIWFDRFFWQTLLSANMMHEAKMPPFFLVSRPLYAQKSLSIFVLRLLHFSHFLANVSETFPSALLAHILGKSLNFFIHWLLTITKTNMGNNAWSHLPKNAKTAIAICNISSFGQWSLWSKTNLKWLIICGLAVSYCELWAFLGILMENVSNPLRHFQKEIYTGNILC